MNGVGGRWRVKAAASFLRGEGRAKHRQQRDGRKNPSPFGFENSHLNSAAGLGNTRFCHGSECYMASDAKGKTPPRDQEGYFRAWR
jgi:hypothetical protein